MDKPSLPPNGRQLLALYLKPAAQWTEADHRRMFELVQDWTGADHLAFAEFIHGKF